MISSLHRFITSLNGAYTVLTTNMLTMIKPRHVHEIIVEIAGFLVGDPAATTHVLNFCFTAMSVPKLD